MGATAIECSGLTRTFRTGRREVLALRGVDLTIGAGRWTALMGPSGSGKSTLLQLLGGLDVPTAGSVRIGDVWLDGLDEARRAVLRRRHVGYVFQFFNLVGNLSVADNVELPLLLAGAGRRAAKARRAEVLDALGIGDLGDADPAELSGGQQQRVAIARAIANRPDVLLADEPTGNLDSANAAEVIRVLQEQHAAGQTIVMVTHDRTVAEAADEIVTLRDGRIVDRASPVARPVGDVPPPPDTAVAAP